MELSIKPILKSIEAGEQRIARLSIELYAGKELFLTEHVDYDLDVVESNTLNHPEIKGSKYQALPIKLKKTGG